MSESSILAKFVAESGYDDLDTKTVEMTKKSLLDALGVTLAASGLCDSCRMFVQLAIEQGGKKESTILGYGKKVSANMAAFANGAMAHALDFEDAHDLALVHPNAPLVPAALALSEAIGDISGKAFIAAMAMGCDIVCRLGLALRVNPTEFGWYIPPILGAFGATAAAGKLLNLNEAQILDAFSLTLCQATCSAELRYSPRSDVRAVRDAFAAKAGVLSALLAKKGVKGFELPFEGKAGLFNLYGKGHYEPSALTKDIGKTYEGANISFKPWPTCRGTHTYIEAALGLMEKHTIRTDQISNIRMIVSNFNTMLCEPIAVKRRPETPIDAKFSLPFVIATALYHKKVTLDCFSADALTNEYVLSLAEKVSYDVDPDLDLRNATQGFLEIRLKNNAIHTKKVVHAYGHPENPISEEALVAKFLNCANHAEIQLPEKQLKNTVEYILNLEDVKNMRDIIHRLE